METEIDTHQHRIVADESGCYFDARTRDFLPDDIDRVPIEAIAALRSASHYLHVLQERWAETLGLSEGRLQVMFILGKTEAGMNLGRLAAMLRVSPRNVTGLVDNLEKAGFVERIPDADDRRSVTARLTATGMARIKAIWKPTMERQIPVTKNFTKEELIQLRHLCLKLLSNAQSLGREEENDDHRR